MVRDTKTLDEPIERCRDIATSPEGLRQRHSFVSGNATIADSDVTRDIIARADADFDRIFGSE